MFDYVPHIFVYVCGYKKNNNKDEDNSLKTLNDKKPQLFP